MSDLAIHGGSKIRSEPFPAYKTLGQEEKTALGKVVDSGVLSAYLGAWHKKFNGGEQVRLLEEEWADFFGCKHAIAVNSNTSGLIASLGAIGLSPGDEVIVSPYSMSISASAPLFYGAIPVFADVDPEYFCLSPESVERRISPRTKAIIIVDLFGHPYAAAEINALAAKHNLLVIEDAAQAPGGRYGDQFTGRLGDIGVFSLNYHKHIHCGEGGLVVTDNDEWADNLRLIRNHAEAVVGPKQHATLVNMVGYNFRMTEMEAAVARCQLAKLPALLEPRIKNALYLSEGLRELEGITPPQIRPDAKHAFYVQGFKFNEAVVGVDRDTFVDAVKAELPVMKLREDEGVLIGCGYVPPLYLQGLYQQRIAFGNKGFPFSLADRSVSYEKGICPVVEQLHYHELFTMDLCHAFMSSGDLDDVIRAFHKVYELRDTLKG